MKLPARIVISAFALLLSPQLLAHRQPEALTTISFNPNAQTTEIVHHLNAHDAVRILDRLPKDQRPDIASIEGRARIALYIEERFALADQNGNPIAGLTLIGATLEGEMIYAYQEYEKELPQRIQIRNDILRDLLPKQTNTVNVTVGTKTQTLVFSKDDKWKSVPQ